MLVRQRHPEAQPRVVALLRSTAPDNAPLLSTVKNHLRIETTAEDAQLQLYINAAVAYVEGKARRSMFDQTWTITYDSLPAGNYLQLFNGPLKGVTTFTTYDDANDPDTTFAGYAVDTQADRLLLNYNTAWPANLRARAGVEIAYTTGHGTAVADLPPILLQAVLMLVGYWHVNRDVTCAVGPEMALGVSDAIAAGRNLHL